jgi:assimilatory nitrate reductase catalytic subunit
VNSKPRFLQGVFPFEGKGFDQPTLIDAALAMRYFPIGAKADTHIPLRVVEDLDGGTQLELHVAAASGSAGFVVVDVGLVEV